jgi:small-conductance mechanosensitive channel/septal ring factor EnvC (AmiA/AmiB activator)
MNFGGCFIQGGGSSNPARYLTDPHKENRPMTGTTSQNSALTGNRCSLQLVRPAQPATESAPLRLRRFLTCCWLLCLAVTVASPVLAAPNPLIPQTGTKPEAQQAQKDKVSADITDEEIDASRARLEARIAELRQQSDTLAATAQRATYLEAATPQELDDWGRLTGKLSGILEDHSTVLFRYRNYRKATRDKLKEMKDWKGFEEKPPYPLALVENLRDALDTKQSVLKSLDVIHTTIESELSEYSSSLKNGSKQIRLAEEDLEKNTGKPGEQRSRWLLALARLQNEVNQAGVVYAETRRLSVAELQKSVQVEVDILNQKLAVSRAHYRFTEEELKQKLQAIDERLQKIRKSLEDDKNREKESRRLLDAAEEAVNKAQDVQAGSGRVKTPLGQLLQEQKRRQVSFEDAGIRVLVKSGMVQLLKSEKVLWGERYRISGGHFDKDLPEEIKSSSNELDMIAKWKSYIVNKLNVIEYNIKVQEKSIASGVLATEPLDDARSFLSVYKSQEALLQQGILFLSNYEQLVQRRDEEAKQKLVTLSGRARGTYATITALFGKFWYTELYVAEETIIVEGKKISRPRSVTVGKVVQAVMILLVGIGVIRYLKGLLHWTATNRLKLGPNDAHLYTRLLGYLLFIIVVVSALVFVNIPLAVFTFFGGALAIGIGFGAQALISNFISGLILMFDRTIRMGDIVEVDGHRGRVAAIGMRSSSIKRFDGVEMLVPNSVFLQQNVVNWTSSDPNARYTISVGVAYGSPTREVERIICTAVEEQQQVLTDPAPYVVFDNFAESALNFTAYFWIELNPIINSMVVFSDIRHRINERLAEAGIAIPFPQRDLHLAADQPLEIRINNHVNGEPHQ